MAYVAKSNHVSPARALALLRQNFPHTLALLQAIPLSAVTAELPGLEAFLEKTLKLTPAQLVVALKANFPALYQAIANLPATTGGSTSSVNWIAPVLLILAVIVILFAALMIVRNLRGVSAREALASAIVVPVVGVVVVALVLVLSLIPRLSSGQKLLDGLRPALTAQRVQGDRAGINMVSAIINTENPIMTASGGAAAEVPKLVAFVSSKTGLTPSAVLAALQKGFPHTTALLKAIPISAVAAELPSLVGFLTPAVVTSIPALLPTVLGAQAVTTGWNDVPGTAGATRFDGTPVGTAADVRAYFSNDVIPVLESQRANFANLDSTSNVDFIGPLVLIIGIVVIVYGLLMVLLARPRSRPARAPTATTARTA